MNRSDIDLIAKLVALAIVPKLETKARPQPAWLTFRGAHLYCGLSVATIRKHALNGEFKHTLKGGRRLINRASLEAWLEAGVKDSMRDLMKRINPGTARLIAASVAAIVDRDFADEPELMPEWLTIRAACARTHYPQWFIEELIHDWHVKVSVRGVRLINRQSLNEAISNYFTAVFIAEKGDQLWDSGY